jgi:hypothetical protein
VVAVDLKVSTNACLPLAACYSQILRQHGIWSKVLQLRVLQGTALKGHSMVVFEFPVGSKKIWTYDSLGSFPVTASLNDPNLVAKMAFEARGQNFQVVAASFLDTMTPVDHKESRHEEVCGESPDAPSMQHPSVKLARKNLVAFRAAVAFLNP